MISLDDLRDRCTKALSAIRSAIARRNLVPEEDGWIFINIRVIEMQVRLRAMEDILIRKGLMTEEQFLATSARFAEEEQKRQERTPETSPNTKVAIQ